MPLLAGACVIAPGGVVTGTGLAKAIADALTAPSPPGTTTSESSLQQFSNLLAAAIVEHIIANGVISVTVTVPPGVPVATAGSALAQTGATTGPGAGTGSGTIA